MAKVYGKIVEEEITFLVNPEVEFVSLVKYAANRMPFKIIKKEDIMDGIMYKVLVPKDIEQKKLEELAKKYSFSVDKEEKGDFKQYRIFIQKDVQKDEKDLSVIKIDESENIYAVVKLELDDKTKQLGLDFLAQSLQKTTEDVLKLLSEPAQSASDRLNKFMEMIGSYYDLGWSILNVTKADETIKLEKKDHTKLEISDIVAKSIKEIVDKYEEAKKDYEKFKGEIAKSIEDKILEIETKIKEESEAFITEKTFNDMLKKIEDKIEKATSVVKRASDILDNKHNNKNDDDRTPKLNKGEFKFFTAI